MPIDAFTPAEMKILLLTKEQVCVAFKLTDQDADLLMRDRISALIMECAVGGERNRQKLIDCALAGLEKDRRQSNT